MPHVGSVVPEDFEEFADDLRARRNYGEVIVHIVQRPAQQAEAPTMTADRLVRGLGMSGLGTAWVTLSEADARRITTDILKQDMAYHMTIMSAEDAEHLVDRFLAFFSGP